MEEIDGRVFLLSIMRTYLHTYNTFMHIHAYVYKYINTYIHAYAFADMHVDRLDICIRTYVRMS